MSDLTIGTRGSTLARVQTEWVEGMILARFPQIRITVKIIRTSADRDTKTSIRSGSATGVFVREIEEALLGGKIDLAVHSMKDLPTRIPDALEIGAIPAREDARDALIAGDGCKKLDDLPRGAVIGTGSVRRQAQVLARRPDLAARDIRGNVETRLQKLAAGSYDAIILACAGLNRLGLQGRISAPLEFSEMLPAPGQGALALEMRRGDERVAAVIAGLNEPATAAAVLAERAFLRRMGGGCNSPIAVHARPDNAVCTIEGLVATPDGGTIIRDAVESPIDKAAEAADALAEELLAMGGAEILKPLR
ncbi:MAG: hydroxymethylbilane synthase [Acidobacteriia bacterium]|nr:hydroxymethylbilane synthase [Terriglobia bacterium]